MLVTRSYITVRTYQERTWCIWNWGETHPSVPVQSVPASGVWELSNLSARNMSWCGGYCTEYVPMYLAT